jgi:hypothetical protein
MAETLLILSRISAFYLHNGITSYLTDTKSNRSDMSFDSLDFENLEKKAVRNNLPYKIKNLCGDFCN